MKEKKKRRTKVKKKRININKRKKSRGYNTRRKEGNKGAEAKSIRLEPVFAKITLSEYSCLKSLSHLFFWVYEYVSQVFALPSTL